MGGLPAKSHLGSAQGLFFASVEHGLVVGLSSAEQVVDNSRELMGRSCNCLSLAELTADPTKELAHVILGVM